MESVNNTFFDSVKVFAWVFVQAVALAERSSVTSWSGSEERADHGFLVEKLASIARHPE